jgi:hypothetical protein
MVVHPDSSRVTRVRLYSGYLVSLSNAAYGAFTLFGGTSQTLLLSKRLLTHYEVLQPHMYKYIWFGLFQFRSPLLSESRLISSPWGTKMVQFPQFSLTILYIQIIIYEHYLIWVPPFGHLWIIAYVQLSIAFRSLSRPSSPRSTKTSPDSP